MKAPLPYFGGKAAVAAQVWAALGDVPNYVEPFLGSAAVLLARPDWTPESNRIETANDADGMVSNFWRALQAEPDAVLRWCDWPCNENDLHARHAWLLARKATLAPRLEGNPDFYDAKIAGWWCWGICLWIGSGWCSGDGPWIVEDGQLINRTDSGGVRRKLVHLGDAGRGINRQLVHLGNAGMGINRQLVHLGNAGRGDAGNGEQGLEAWLQALAARLRRVRVCCGDWARVMGDTPTIKNGLTGIFLDPPYSDAANRQADLYTTDDLTVAHDVRAWCLAHGDNPLLRIVLAGYRDEHDDLERHGWRAEAWKSRGGYGSQGNGNGRANAAREVLWYSPHCLAPAKRTQASLFEEYLDD